MPAPHNHNYVVEKAQPYENIIAKTPAYVNDLNNFILISTFYIKINILSRPMNIKVHHWS